MIPKASQRGGGQQLATHLLNEFDNDRVEVAELRGAIAKDLHGAFAEWRAVATGTNCRKYLYSLSVNPDPEQGPLTREQYRDFVDRTEKKLGLDGQPRALVFHVKHGREHCHAVWSRIDVARMKAVQLSNDRYSLRSVVIAFAREHGLELPRGMTRDRVKERSQRQRPENLAEQQQEERTGITKAERVAAITAAWRESSDARGFIGALEARGYLLARGDKRAYVVVDRFGEIHGLARQIDGARAKDVKDRLAPYPAENLPDAKAAQAYARQQREAAAQQNPAFRKTAEERRKDLETVHSKRRSSLEERYTKLREQHDTERGLLADAQQAETRGILSARLRNQPRGIVGFLVRITGVRLLVAHRHKRQDRVRRDDHARQSDALARRHRRERQEFQHHFRALASVEKRERRSLETLLRRERVRAAAPPEGATLAPARLIDEWRRVTRPPKVTGPSGPSGKNRIARIFNEEAAGATGKAKSARKGARSARKRLQPIRDNARDITVPADPAHKRGLAETFRRSADPGPQDAAADTPDRRPHRDQARRPPGPDHDRER